MAKLRKPPFSRGLSDQAQTVRLYVGYGEAWDRGNNESVLGWRNFLVLPGDEDPNHYLWPVNGRPVLIVILCSYQGRQLKRLALCLLRAGAQPVLAISALTNRCQWFGEPPPGFGEAAGASA